MGLIEDIAAFKLRVKTRIRDKTAQYSATRANVGDSFDELADLLVELLPDGIISGLEVRIVDTNIVIGPGTWKIAGVLYTTTVDTIIPYDAQDPTLSRYDIIYGDINSTIQLLSGQLSATPVEPGIPTGTLKIASILITPTTVVLQPPPTNGFVDLFTDQFIDGFKSFIKSPQVPTATGADDAVPFNQAQDLASFDEIIDTEPDYNAAGLLSFINNSPLTLAYTSDGGPQTIAPTVTKGFTFNDANPSDIPAFTFIGGYFYSIEPDGIALGDGAFLKNTDAQAKMAMFTKVFALDYITSNTNGNINIDAKNLIVSVVDSAVRASITQLQIKDTTSNTVVYDALSSLGADLLHLGNELNVAHNFKVLVASPNTNLQIAVTSGNGDTVIYKLQQFLTGDTDNAFVAPISVSIYPAS